MKALGQRFSERAAKLGDGSQISIEYVIKGTAEAAQSIADGQLKTELWLAESSSWVNLVNATLTNLGPKQEPCRTIFSSPIVLAVRSDIAKSFFHELETGALAWPKPLHSVEGLQLVHSNPTRSATGLAALQQIAVLANSDLGDAGATARVNMLSDSSFDKSLLAKMKDYESLMSSYGESEQELLQLSSHSVEGQIRGVITTEQAVNEFNRNSEPDFSAAPYARDTVALDYQLCTSEADWVSPAHQAAISRFLDFLTSREASEIISAQGYRPTDLFGSAPPFEMLPLQEVQPLDPSALQSLRSAWTQVRRPLALTVIIDGSGSMEGAPLDLGRDELRRMITLMETDDVMAIHSFHSTPTQLQDFTSDQQALLTAVDRLKSLGGSAIYDSIKIAAEALEHPRWKSYRRSILLYTDGDDRNSIIPKLSAQSSLPNRLVTGNIHFTIIALSNPESQHHDLIAMSSGAGGQYYESDIDGVRVLFRRYMGNI